MSEDKKEYIYETADKSMYHLLRKHAEENKLFMTDAERALWYILKSNGIDDKFRRQHVIDDYIVDFVNLKHKVVIEIDGKYHFKGEQPVSDALRTADLNKLGYSVVRFTNEEVLNTPFQVISKIKGIMNQRKEMQPISAPQKTPIANCRQSPLLLEGTGEAIVASAWAVDAACSGNPGPMEYQGIDLQTGARVFHYGPVHGTNNIGEFLAIVHALALMDKQGITDKTIYSDSYNAILWVRNKKCKTKLVRDANTEQLYAVIARAEQWLRTHAVTVPIVQWQTRQWGDIPADFGRKK